ncbi:helix-turn-helix domain-containing protein [Hymenobacter metallilatus]|uniref:AraC family transcriptional regulator n=1 Tax=Hymenobacter metallilatus TaxID=2493666 RepID=A0A3R9M681_9BACT|nr:helix-turn-helix transcriptional regulator [Hymenobacter metallilatus]RSK31141.1 AraC family transcriptional regulator [Hymenobacter metallilatus]
MNTSALEKLYAKFVPVAGSGLPADTRREIGHFDVFNLENRRPGHSYQPPMPFDRQRFYKVSLIHGHSRIEYTDHAIDIQGSTLFLATPHVPYRWVPQTATPTGYFCIFTDEFLLPAKGGMVLDELPVFQPDAYPVRAVTAEQAAAVEAIFRKMAQELASDYAYKYDLLRAYLLELLHFTQKLQPAAERVPTHSAATRIATRFTELLEQQFPLHGTPVRRLRTAKEYADALAMHINHLNRALKETTGHTTTELLGQRTAQEAKLLLKQSDRGIAEIADQLGFTDVAHFCTFFKRQTGLTPGKYRG